MFDLSQVPTAIKWVAGVLIAGFIAQFGRIFAEYLVNRCRKKKQVGDDAAVLGKGNDSLRVENQAPQQAKALKKELKARQKIEKKKK